MTSVARYCTPPIVQVDIRKLSGKTDKLAEAYKRLSIISSEKSSNIPGRFKLRKLGRAQTCWVTWLDYNLPHRYQSLHPSCLEIPHGLKLPKERFERNFQACWFVYLVKMTGHMWIDVRI